MAEILTRDNEMRSLNEQRFVRVGNIIYHNRDYSVSHESIAHQAGVRDSGKLKVDDAGFLYFMNGTIKAGGNARSVEVIGDVDGQRDLTNTMLEEIFGKE